jgi:hypothetical protein
MGRSRALETRAELERMNIGVFLGEGQYGTAGYFLAALAREWRTAGHQVFEIAVGPRFPATLQDAVRGKVELVFGYNGFGGELAIQGRSLYELLGARFFAWFVDHLVHHRERITRLPAGSIIATVDPSHLGYLAELGAGSASSLWLPHFACYAPSAASARDLSVLVPGTVHDPDAIRAQWQSRPDIAGRCEALVQRAVEQERVVWHEVLADVVSSGSGQAGGASDASRHVAVMQADKFVRARRRRAMIDALGRAGAQVTVCGHVEATVTGLENLDVRGPVPFSDLLDLMTRAHIVVDTGAAFPEGSHERGLSAMANGALAVVERNGFWEQFSEHEVHHFSWNALDRLAQEIREFTADLVPVTARAQAGCATVARSHTAAHRAATVVEAAGIRAFNGGTRSI